MKITSLSKIKSQPLSHNPNVSKKVMISGDEIDNIVYFSQAVFPPGEIAKGHQHKDMTEIFYIQSGQGQIQIDRRVFDLSPGVSVTVERGETHEIRNTGSLELIVIYLGVLQDG